MATRWSHLAGKRQPEPPAPQTVAVIKTEEKGSDVNLATYLLVDAFRGDADNFVVVSNDSDLTEPLRIVKHELGRRIGLLNPHPTPSRALARCGPDFTRQIRRGVILNSQFPITLHAGGGGVLTKPSVWL